MPVPGISRRIPGRAVRVVGDPGELQVDPLVPAQREKPLSDRSGVSVVRAEGVDGGDLVGEPADVAFGVADLAALGVRARRGGLVSDRSRTGRGGGEGGEFDVALVAGGDRGDGGELLGDGGDGFVAQVAGHLLGVRHCLGDEVGFALQDLPRVGVGGAFGDVAVDLDGRVVVALADEAAFGLFEPVGPVGGGELVGGVEPGLDVDPDAHLHRRADQDPGVAGSGPGPTAVGAGSGRRCRGPRRSGCGRCLVR